MIDECDAYLTAAYAGGRLGSGGQIGLLRPLAFVAVEHPFQQRAHAFLRLYAASVYESLAIEVVGNGAPVFGSGDGATYHKATRGQQYK